MTSRMKKKLSKRKGFFKYREYKQRLSIYNAFVSGLENNPAPDSIKTYFLDQLDFTVFQKLPKKIYRRNHTVYNKDILVNEIAKFYGNNKTAVKSLLDQFNCVADCPTQSFEIEII